MTPWAERAADELHHRRLGFQGQHVPRAHPMVARPGCPGALGEPGGLGATGAFTAVARAAGCGCGAGAVRCRCGAVWLQVLQVLDGGEGEGLQSSRHWPIANCAGQAKGGCEETRRSCCIATCDL